MRGERGAQAVADEADLVLVLAEADGFALPERVEDPGLPVHDVRTIPELAHALPDAGAAARAEQIVVVERDVAPKPFVGGVAGAELDAPRLGLPHRDLDIPERGRRGAAGLDVDPVEEARGVEPAAGLGQIDGRELTTRRELQLTLDHVRLGGGEPRDQDLPDPDRLAFLHRIGRRHTVRGLGGGQADFRVAEATTLIEPLHPPASVLDPPVVPGVAGTQPDRLEDQLRRHRPVALHADRAHQTSRAFDDRDHDLDKGPVLTERGARRPHLGGGEALRL